MSKVVYVGGNYANHTKEIGGSTPEEPVPSTKLETTLYDLCQPLAIPSDMGSARHEVELAVLIGVTLRQVTEGRMRKTIAGYSAALSLAPRGIQDKMKKAGQPWEKTEGFDNSYSLSGFIPVAKFDDDLQDTILGLTVNGELRQHGTMADMIHHIVPSIACMSRLFTLKVGSIVLTGMPAGVGPLDSGDELTISFHNQTLTTRVLQPLPTTFSGGKTYISVPDWLQGAALLQQRIP